MDVRDRQILSESPSETLAECYDFQRHHVDVLCGGFPCQDISNAGRRAGISGERSGLWRYMVQAIRVVRPKFAIVENVAALLGRGMGTVLGDLAESGYDSEWNSICAADMGAPHIRERIWIVAYPISAGLQRAETADFKNVRLLGKSPTKNHPFSYESQLFKFGNYQGIRKGAGIPNWMDRIKGIGNSVVPQIVEWIGRQLYPTPSDLSGK